MAAPKKLTLPVLLAPAVVDELHGVWLWNAQQHSPAHADAYLAFLKGRIDGLDRRYRQGKTVNVRPDLQYVLIRRRSKGHGHVAVYRVDHEKVNVLHIFHTAQDWQTKLAGEHTGPE